MGEATAPRARASIQSQSQRPHETIRVAGITPYHRAINHAARQVSTEFMVPVDADMVLDSSCFEDLRNCVVDRVALVVGCLRDPMLGRIQGVKLIRTAALLEQDYPDTISSDVDFASSLHGRGWFRVQALKPGSPIPHTFGEHRPDYTPRYTFGRFYVQGARYRYRGSIESLQELVHRLALSDHPCASIAVLAAAHGVFLCQDRDHRDSYVSNSDFQILEELERGPAPSTEQAPLPPGEVGGLESTYRAFLGHGRELRECRAFPFFEERMLALARHRDPVSWAGLLGLCHGLFTEEGREQRAVEELRELLAIMPASLRREDPAS